MRARVLTGVTIRMQASGTGEASPRRGSGRSAAALVRSAGPGFDAGFAALRTAVARACMGASRWEARVVMGLRAGLEFAAADPEAARALTIQARRSIPHAAAEGRGLSRASRDQEVIAHFTEQLERVTPEEKLVSVGSARGVVDAAATLVRGSLLAGRSSELPAALPGLVYLALLPYKGHDEAAGWATLSPRC